MKGSSPAWLLSILVLASTGVCAWAGDINLDLSTSEAYVNEPISVRIRVINAQDHSPPQYPDINGAEVQDLGQTGRNQSVSFVNGKMTRNVTLTYVFLITPTKPGTLIIPSIGVRVDGDMLKTPARKIKVTESTTGDLMFLKLTSDRDSVYFGETIDVNLEIWLKIYRDQNITRGLSAQEMLGLINVQQSNWGVFKETLDRIDRRDTTWQYRRASGKNAGGVAQSYHVYVLEQSYTPIDVGPIGVGNISVVTNYPTRTAVKRGIFGDRLQVSGSRPIRASLGASDILVQSPPNQDAPPFFNGAVGQYTFSAQARNTEVRVREPIELIMTISGQGVLDRVPPPPLLAMEAITQDFKVPEERMAGLGNERQKQFTVTIRPKNADVAEIPPIPFVYFDPVAEKYVSLASDSIPINVTPSEQVSLDRFAMVDEHNGNGINLTQTAAGIRANYADIDALLSQQSYIPGAGTVGMLAAAPLVYLCSLLIVQRRRRMSTDTGYARRRGAASRAVAGIEQALQGDDAGEAASIMAGAVISYISDRCNASTGLTSAEAIEQLTLRHIDSESVQKVESFLGECEALQYAGGDQNRDLDAQARQCIDELEKERF